MTDRALPRSFASPGLYVRNARDVWLMGDGPPILDFSAGAGAACLGHSAARRILFEATGAVHHAHTSQFASDSADQLTNLMTDGVWKDSHGPGTGAWWTCSGTEAVEAAMKIAYQYQVSEGQGHRRKFAVRVGAYHGNTLGALSVSGIPARAAPYAPLLRENAAVYMPILPTDYSRGYADTRHKFLDDTIASLQPHAAELVAVIVEPIGGTMVGCTAPPDGYLAALHTWCGNNGVLLIYDEVFCGTWRSGHKHAWQYQGHEPHLQVVGKAVAAGIVPLSGVLVAPVIVNQLACKHAAIWHTQTFQAHDFACRVGVEVQKEINGLIKANNSFFSTQGLHLENALHAAMHGCRFVSSQRGAGLMRGYTIQRDQSGALFRHEDGIGRRIQKVALQKGLSVYVGAGAVDGVLGDVVNVSPAYTMSPVLMEHGAHILRAAIDTVCEAVISAS